MGEHVVGVIEVHADGAHFIISPQAKTSPRVRGNHLDHGMENFRPVGRAPLGDNVVHGHKGQAGGKQCQNREHPAVAVTEPQRRHHHGNHQCQNRTTALAEHGEGPQASQCRQPQHLQATPPRWLVEHQEHSRTNDIGPQDGVGYFADTRQPEQQRRTLHPIELDDGD
ncbi:hypothetical protein D3C79_518910 [compost metagenome]